MRRRGRKGGVFLSVSLSKGREEDGDEGNVGESIESLGQNGFEKNVEVVEEKEVEVKRSGTSAALNTTKHLWAGVLAAMVSRTFVAPLERLKLEYIVRVIAATQGLKGFWKGNFVNILRTAPFKSINFYAYDTYRSQLLKLSGTRKPQILRGSFLALLPELLLLCFACRWTLTRCTWELCNGTFRHMIQTEGFFSLYKGLLPSLSSFTGRKEETSEHQTRSEELNALEQLELGTKRTLLYGAIAGCCSEAATYPFEVVRRQLQMQVRATKMSALATCIKIVEQGGIPALYAALDFSNHKAVAAFNKPENCFVLTGGGSAPPFLYCIAHRIGP
uniref:Uncharacterized protein n=1 Tax=Salix viminalis TaxID=40686 RepID=A0A6N2KP45_SALVM